MGPYGGGRPYGYGWGRKPGIIQQILEGLIGGANAGLQGYTAASDRRQQQEAQKQQLDIQKQEIGIRQAEEARRAAADVTRTQQEQAAPFLRAAPFMENPVPLLTAGGQISTGQAVPGERNQDVGNLGSLLPDLAGQAGGTTPGGPGGTMPTTSGHGYEAPPASAAMNLPVRSLAQAMGMSGRPRFTATLEEEAKRAKAAQDAAALLEKQRAGEIADREKAHWAALDRRQAAKASEQTGTAQEKAAAAIYNKVYDQVHQDTSGDTVLADKHASAAKAAFLATLPKAAPQQATPAAGAQPTPLARWLTAATNSRTQPPRALPGELGRMLPDLGGGRGPASSPDSWQDAPETGPYAPVAPVAAGPDYVSKNASVIDLNKAKGVLSTARATDIPLAAEDRKKKLDILQQRVGAYVKSIQQTGDYQKARVQAANDAQAIRAGKLTLDQQRLVFDRSVAAAKADLENRKILNPSKAEDPESILLRQRIGRLEGAINKARETGNEAEVKGLTPHLNAMIEAWDALRARVPARGTAPTSGGRPAAASGEIRLFSTGKRQWNGSAWVPVQ